MKIFLKLSLFVLLLILASCKEDFIEVDNPGALSPANYPNSVADLEQLLTGVYATQGANGLFGHHMLNKGSNMWDHTADLSWQGTPTWISMAQNNSQPADPFLYNIWRELYRGVQRSNTLLEGIETYRAKAPKDQMAAIDLIKGQALYLRAWYYYYLETFWGETFIIDGKGGEKMGVPIITKAASTLDETQASRNTVKEVWDFIVSDLKQSETLLTNKVWTSNADKHKVTGWAVKGFLGKTYVYLENWPEAKKYLGDVIDNSGKSLVPFDVYKTMFNGQNEHNSESLYEVQFNEDVIRGGGDQSMGSNIGMILAPTYVSASGGQAASAWSNVFPHAKNIERFGFNEGHYFKPDVTVANIANVDQSYITRSQQARKNKTVDPRLWVACFQPYVDSMVVSGKLRPISHYLDVTELSMEAWSFRKYTKLDGTEAEANFANGSNILWLRLADVYLLYAETLTHTGDNATALEYVNKVKRRAYGLPVNTPSTRDYKNLTDVTMASDAVLKNNPLRYERWAELFAEGNWWFDVARWKIGPQEAAYYQKVRGGPIQFDAWDYAQPIPNNETTANVSIQQNPGY